MNWSFRTPTLNLCFLLTTTNLFIVVALSVSYASAFSTPPNQPAPVSWDGTTFQLQYNGQVIFTGRLENTSAKVIFQQFTEKSTTTVTQVFKWSSRTTPLHLVGKVRGSEAAFPCEAEAPEDAPQIIRHCYGLSHHLNNRAVYERQSDWLISVDFPTQVRITPHGSENAGVTFDWEMTGPDLILRFRPRYYQRHRGLQYYQPWTYSVWQESVAGWCSWFAYFRDIDEAKIRHTADVLAETLAPFGLEYLQIDDGFQQTPVGLPDTWLVPNPKFPAGLENLSAYIRQQGLKPGIWTATSFHDPVQAKAWSDLFIPDASGAPAYGSWVGYILDGSNPKALEQITRPIYRRLKSWDWQYYKVDALRHLRYEGYNSQAEYFQKKNLDRTAIFRNVVRTIREEVGRENFILGCWGIRPELIGLIDACRIGDDGFGYGGLAEYNSFNNVVWRNDPDHIELTPGEAYRSCMVTSLTGSLLMLTDPPEVYQTPLVEAARRALPVLFTRPGQVYDVDPKRSSQLNRVDSELSGAGPRVFDADQAPYCHLYLLEINKTFENWVVLGRTGAEPAAIAFSDLGLAPQAEYLIFEFWSQQFIGSLVGQFAFPAIDPAYHCQLFCIRARTGHPQVLATNRHMSCGGFDLEAVHWQAAALMGESQLVAKDGYKIFVFEPANFQFQTVTCAGAEILSSNKKGGLRVIELKSGASQKVKWALHYQME
ncbi:alpha-galactosidase [candidate division KSB1 bacterium]|nr:alpha-galactosidase [candidate division KSB1 bacterium]